MSRDALEAWADAAAGLIVATALVWALSAAFFAVGVPRRYAVRRLFRRLE